MVNYPKISVIIPTTRDTVFDLLNSIASVKYPKNRMEVIVLVDRNELIYRKLDKLESSHNKPRFLIDFSQKRRGRCRVKNIGASLASGDILFFFDDDVIIRDPLYFKRIVNDFSSHTIAAVGAREVKLHPKGSFKRFIERKLVEYGFIGKILPLGEVVSAFDAILSKPIEVDILPGCNWAVRAEVFREVGGFDESYDIGTAYREETDLQIRIKKAGYRLLFEPRTFVIHKEVQEAYALKKWAYWYYILNTYFYCKNFSPTLPEIIIFATKELIGGILRTLAYGDFHLLAAFPNLFKGIRYCKSAQTIIQGCSE